MTARILIIDPEPATAPKYTPLQEAHHTIEVVHSIDEMVEGLQRELPDLLIIDDKTNPDAFIFARKIPEAHTVPIIFIAVGDNTRGMQRALGYGACDVLVKPFSPQELLLRVNLRIAEGRQGGEILQALDIMAHHFPHEAAFQLKLAEGCEQHNMLEKALQHYKNLAQIYSREGNFAQGTKALERIVALLHTHFPNRVHALQQVSALIAELALLISQEEESLLSHKFSQLTLQPHGTPEPTGLPMEQFLKIKRGEEVLPEEALPMESQEIRAIESPSSLLEAPVLQAEEVSVEMIEPLTTEFQLTKFLSEQEIEELQSNLQDQEEASPLLNEALSKSNSRILTDHQEDHLFLKKLELSGFLPQGRIVECIAEQELLALRGKNCSLREVIEQKKLLRSSQLLFIEQAAVAEFKCPQCHKTFYELSKTQEPCRQKPCQQCDSPLLYDVMKEEDHSAKPLLDKGQSLLGARYHTKAIRVFSQAIERFPENPDAYAYRATAHLNRNQFLEALADANKALSLDSNNFQALCQRGRCYYYLQQFDEAIEDLSVLVKRRLYLFEAYSTRGKAYYNKKQYEQAIADLTETIRLRPKFVKAYIYRGRCYYRLGEFALALHDFKRALAINPHFHNAVEIKKMLEASRVHLQGKRLKRRDPKTRQYEHKRTQARTKNYAIKSSTPSDRPKRKRKKKGKAPRRRS